jgi:hypothetical protein
MLNILITGSGSTSSLNSNSSSLGNSRLSNNKEEKPTSPSNFS